MAIPCTSKKLRVLTTLTPAASSWCSRTSRSWATSSRTTAGRKRKKRPHPLPRLRNWQRASHKPLHAVHGGCHHHGYSASEPAMLLASSAGGASRWQCFVSLTAACSTTATTTVLPAPMLPMLPPPTVQTPHVMQTFSMASPYTSWTRSAWQSSPARASTRSPTSWTNSSPRCTSRRSSSPTAS